MMSKINLHLDYAEIRIKLDAAMGSKRPSEWAKLVGVSKNVVTNIHGATQQKPSIEYIIAVARATDKPAEWYLYGVTPENRTIYEAADPRGEYNAVDPSGAGPCPVKCDEKLRKLCARVKKVMEPNDGFSKALEANIYAFEESANMKKEIQNIRQTSSMGPGGGIPQAPARSAAKRRKAG